MPAGTEAAVNFETEQPPAFFATLFQANQLHGGHVIQLGPGNEAASLEALQSFPGGLHVGGGLTPINARQYLDAGASHVIVTSYVFRNGDIDMDRLREFVAAVGKERSELSYFLIFTK
jgi:phosphoribosylformimino-5-aminoimidazole carboxamide ribotide isomerase